MSKKLLVIGSVHLDIVATSNPVEVHRIDREGDVRISVGGTAYNIAANIAFESESSSSILGGASLFTFIDEESLGSTLIVGAIEASGINSKYVQIASDLGESGYIAHHVEKDLVAAVSSAPIHKKSFDQATKKKLRRAIRGHSLVAIDTNLGKHQISTIVEAVASEGKHLFVANVSDSKVLRLTDLGLEKEAFRLVALNEAELSAALPDSASHIDEKVCAFFTAKTVIVTKGIAGYRVFSTVDAERYEGAALEQTGVISTLGAGDALFAAVCTHFMENNSIEWQACHQKIVEQVSKVLRSETAVPSGLQRKIERHDSEGKGRTHVIAGCFGVASILTALTMFGFFSNSVSYVSCFLLVPILAGISGSLIQSQLSTEDVVSQDAYENAVLGGVAGFMVALLFFLSQMSLLPKLYENLVSGSLTPEMFRLSGFLLIFGFAAGMGFNSVFVSVRSKLTRVLDD